MEDLFDSYTPRMIDEIEGYITGMKISYLNLIKKSQRSLLPRRYATDEKNENTEMCHGNIPLYIYLQTYFLL